MAEYNFTSQDIINEGRERRRKIRGKRVLVITAYISSSLFLIDEICIMGLVSHAIYTKSLLSYS
jgi:hypothetical protein